VHHVKKIKQSKSGGYMEKSGYHMDEPVNDNKIKKGGGGGEKRRANAAIK